MRDNDLTCRLARRQIWIVRSHHGMTRLARLAAVALVVALTAASAQAFSFADQLGRIPGLLGGQSSSRLAKPYAVLHESFYPTSVVWSPDGKYVADTGILTPVIHIWNVRTKQIVKALTLNAQSDGYHAMAWSPDGRYLAVCANTGPFMAGVWDTETWKLVARPAEPYRGFLGTHGDYGCQSPAFTPNNRGLAIATGDEVYLYSTIGWAEVAHSSFTDLSVGYAFNIYEIAFQPNTSELAIGIHGYFLGDPDSGHARVIFWNINNPAPDQTNGRLLADSFIAYGFGGLNSLAYNPNGKQLATGTNSGGGSADTQVTDSARIWNPTNHKLIGAPLDGHDRAGDINGLAYSADGRYLIAAHGSGKIDFIDARSLKVVDTLYADHLIGAIAVNPRAPMFVATDNNKLMIWSIK